MTQTELIREFSSRTGFTISDSEAFIDILKECIVIYPMSDGEHFKILYHWDEETHEYFITQ